ncbi:MAG: putative DNA binding domain-containing protein [Deltaproteobacteria bacterium]|nr:putative DNA binding domain-containing protein [Deltaproteobacteria bacterium]
MNFSDLQARIAGGESTTLELKKSTAQLRRAGETLCAFLNAEGGTVIMGVTSEGKVVGQEVSDGTRREIAAMLDRFEPPAAVAVHVVDLPATVRKLIVLEARAPGEARPFSFEGRPYQRVQTSTSVMPQARYEALLLDRAHVRRRWENQAAVDVALDHLDQEEILRTREAAVRQRRISAGTSTDVGDILDRLGLRRDGVITQAAQILYGTRFLPDYPQGMLKMGRFRGSSITGDILDNRQEHLHAFAIVREAMDWLDRTLPLAAHFPPGQIFREDRQPVPPAALREVLLNAVMHRDYAHPSSYVALAVFDDRIEVRSLGGLPRGVTAESLSRTHKSVLRNPLIAEAFHRTGAVEVWGRGTNRVIEECRRYGIAPPTFEEDAGFVVVTFQAEIAPSRRVTPQVGTKSGPSRDQVQVLELAREARSMPELLARCGRSSRTKFRDQVVRPLLEAGLLEMTMPDKPRSSLQRYRTTPAGERLLTEES